jgi:hypothetical protein
MLLLESPSRIVRCQNLRSWADAENEVRKKNKNVVANFDIKIFLQNLINLSRKIAKKQD